MICLKKLYFVLTPVIICAVICFSSFCNRSIAESILSVDNSAGKALPTIIIDPGHGGFDGGASTSDGYAEKHINLKISLYLRELLVLSGYDVIITRSEDISLEDDGLETIREKKKSDIYNRMDIMEKTDNAIFISIHQNYYHQEKYYGTQVFYSGNQSAESQLIAESIQETVVELLQNDNTRKVKECGTSVYLMYNAVKPAVLVECGFLSNYKEAELLKTDEYQRKMSYCIYLGIQKYLLRGRN